MIQYRRNVQSPCTTGCWQHVRRVWKIEKRFLQYRRNILISRWTFKPCLTWREWDWLNGWRSRVNNLDMLSGELRISLGNSIETMKVEMERFPDITAGIVKPIYSSINVNNPILHSSHIHISSTHLCIMEGLLFQMSLRQYLLKVSRFCFSNTGINTHLIIAHWY